MRVARLALACALALAGCDDLACTRNSDCAAPLVCSALGACIHPPVGDGGGDDGGDGGASSADGGARELSAADDAASNR
jgi:hypothetical protein